MIELGVGLSITEGLKFLTQTFRNKNASKEDMAQALDIAYDLREKVADMQDENHALRIEVRSLQEKLAEREELSFDSNTGLYIIDGDPTPFCPRCHDVDEKRVRLRYKHGSQHSRAGHLCKGCDKFFPSS